MSVMHVCVHVCSFDIFVTYGNSAVSGRLFQAPRNVLFVSSVLCFCNVLYVVRIGDVS